MNRRDLLITGAAALAAPALAQASALHVDAIQVLKGQRRLQLLAGSRILKTYKIQLGRDPDGPKRFEGDNRTPEGVYQILRRVPDSAFFKSMMISYPSTLDVQYARKYRRPAGGDICIHGQPNGVSGRLRGDWTAGCIALSNADMDELDRTVPLGTHIRIFG